MQRRQVLILASLGPCLAHATVSPRSEPSPLHWRERALLGLGTTLALRAAHREADELDRALDAAVAAIRRVEASMSLYRPDSEISRLNRTGSLESPSADLLAVLHAGQEVSRRSRGAFDATVQPLWETYDRAQAARRLPTVEELQAARARVGWQYVSVTAERVRMRPGMALTLNGIAQGYAADAALAALRQHGVENALVDAGEHALLGVNERGLPWTLGVEDPRAEQALLAALRCDGRAVATSADQRSAFTPDRRHHHIIDPSTGRSPPELASVTVLASQAMLADALTKVMFIGGPRRIPALARAWGVGVLWVDKGGRWQATPDVPLA